MQDLVNASFEGIGAVLTWLNVYRLLQDREVKGVYWPVTAFWSAWGIWNLYYYPSLDQWMSFAAGVILCLGNLTWVALYLIIRKPEVRAPAIEPVELRDHGEFQ